MSISESIAARNAIKLAWETDFNKNYESVATTLAKWFAQTCFNDIVNSIKDPYKNLYSPHNKYLASLDFNITYRYEGSTIRHYLTATKLPPFVEWAIVLGEKNDRCDTDYFCSLMEKVRQAAAPILQQECKRLAATSVIEKNKLNSEVIIDTCYSLCVKFWFDSEKLPYQFQLIKDKEDISESTAVRNIKSGSSQPAKKEKEDISDSTAVRNIKSESSPSAKREKEDISESTAEKSEISQPAKKDKEVISESISGDKNLAWERDFEKNYLHAAAIVAAKFAKSSFDKLVASLKEPNNNLYSSKNKYTVSLNFNITDVQSNAIRLFLIKTQLPPFVEWAKLFNEGGKGKYDESYYCGLMKRVREAAQLILQINCEGLAAKYENNKLNCETIADNDNSLSVKYWFESDNEEKSNESQ